MDFALTAQVWRSDREWDRWRTSRIEGRLRGDEGSAQQKRKNDRHLEAGLWDRESTCSQEVQKCFRREMKPVFNLALCPGNMVK